MPYYEYITVPAPKAAKRVKGIKGVEARYAQTMTDVMNEFANEGWQYLRADAFPIAASKGLFGKAETVSVTMLVFRRELVVDHSEYAETALTPEELAEGLDSSSPADYIATPELGPAR